MNAHARTMSRTGCRAHAFCEAVLEFAVSARSGVRDCDSGHCDGQRAWDTEDAWSLFREPQQFTIPAPAQHATWNAERGQADVLCTECMNTEQQTLPPSWEQNGNGAGA